MNPTSTNNNDDANNKNNNNNNSSSSSSSSGGVRRPMSIYEMIMTSKDRPLTSSKYSYREAMHRPIPQYTDNDLLLMNNNNRNTTTNNNFKLEQLTRISLPYFQPWTPIAGPTDMPPDFTWLTESCSGKAAIGVLGGGMMGLLMGIFLGAMSDTTPPITIIAGKEVPQAPIREQLKLVIRATSEKSIYWCRNFAFITGVFAGSECIVEKYRSKHDRWNSVVSGCITGAALQAKQGPSSAAIGCGGFAAFSLVIDSFMGHY